MTIRMKNTQWINLGIILLLFMQVFASAFPVSAATQDTHLSPAKTTKLEEQNLSSADIAEGESRSPQSLGQSLNSRSSQTQEENHTPELHLSLTPPKIVPGSQATLHWEITELDIEDNELILTFTFPEGVETKETLVDFDITTRALTIANVQEEGELELEFGDFEKDAVILATLSHKEDVILSAVLQFPEQEEFLVDQNGGRISVETDGFFSTNTNENQEAQLEFLKNEDSPEYQRQWQLAEENSKVHIDVPVNVFSSDTKVYVGKPVNATRPEYSLSGAPFEITAYNASTEKEIRQFNDTITLEIPFSHLDIPEPQIPNISLYWYNTDLNSWEALPSVADQSRQVIRAYTDHFTVFDIGIDNWQASRLPTVDAFQVSSFTGAGTYAFPIQVPAGPGGLQPTIALNYNSQIVDQATTKSQASWAGMGWSLEVGSIERNLNGTPNHKIDDTFMFNLGGVSSTIVHTSDGYKLSNENFWRLEYNEGLNWTVWDKQGNQYFFEKIITMPFPDSTCSMKYLDHKWLLTRVVNVHGKTLQYEYDDEIRQMHKVYVDGGGTCVLGQLIDTISASYLSSITYPNGRYQITFERENRQDYDATNNYVNGQYRAYERSRLTQINILQDADGIGSFETLVRKYELSYKAENASDTIWPGFTYTAGGHVSTLAEIREYGKGGTDTLPATTFTYGDNLHLTDVDNGYGGTVTFTYDEDPWYYNEDARDTYTKEIDFGTAGAPCFNESNALLGWSARSGEVTCGDDDHDPLHIYSIGTTDGVATSGAYTKEMIRPGGTYQYVIGSSEHNGASFTPKIFSGSADIDYDAIESGDPDGTPYIFRLPTNASEAKPLLVSSDGLTTVGYLRIELLPAFYRVTQKTINDGQGNSFSSSYEYSDPAVNTYDNSPSSCVPEDYPEYDEDCEEYYEKYSEFRGHGLVIETSPTGQITETYYHQDEILRGRPEKIIIRDVSETIVSSSYYAYNTTLLDFNKPGVAECSLCDPYSGLTHTWVTLESLATQTYAENGTSKVTKVNNTYESNYGNLTHRVESSFEPGGRGWEWVPYRETITAYSFLLDSENPDDPFTSSGKYLAALPARQTVQDANGVLLSSTLYLYDNNSNIETLPTEGILTATRMQANETDFSQVSFGYDTWGNQTTITSYSGFGTSTNAPTAGAHTSTTTYDSVYHTYPVQQSNPLGQTISTVYDYALGVPTRITDLNGNLTSGAYDNFGRLTKIIRPGDSSVSPTIRIAYFDGPGFHVLAEQRVSGSIYNTVDRYYDGVGREILLKTGEKIAGQPAILSQQTTSYEYLGTGLLTTQSIPFGDGETTSIGTETQTDSLGRVIEIRPPNGNDISYSYDGLFSTVFDAKGYPTTTEKDVWGRIIHVDVPEGPDSSYSYDELGQLTDTYYGGAHTEIGYDMLGRKTSMEDPDMGDWTYAYDALGNLTHQTDARGCITTLDYDVLNRLEDKSSAGIGCGQQINITYHYDETPNGNQGVGLRTSMNDGSGSTSWTYDERGRMIEEDRSIAGEPFTTSWTYNSADLPITMTYPDGEVLTYAYGDGGRLKTITSSLGGTYLGDMQYDEAGRIESMIYGNDILDKTFVYANWNTQTQGGMLSGISTVRASDSQTLQDLVYAYDANGNVDTITDNIIPGTQLQSFGYDTINRLTSTVVTGGTYGIYSETYDYNATTGNFLSKSDVINDTTTIYTFGDSDHIHAASGLSDNSAFTYDANGNMITRNITGESTYHYSYDADNRLVEAEIYTGSATLQDESQRVALPNKGLSQMTSAGKNTWTYIRGLSDRSPITSAIQGEVFSALYVLPNTSFNISSYIAAKGAGAGDNSVSASFFGDPSRWTTALSTSSGWSADTYPRMFADVNGDGNNDALGFGIDGIYVALSDGNNSFETSPSRWTTFFSNSSGWSIDTYPRMFADVNGDGNADAVGFANDGVYVALSDGNSSFITPASRWTTAFSNNSGWSVDTYPRMFADVNGDGNDDALGFGSDGVYVALSNGSSFASPASRWTTAFSNNSGWSVDTYPRMFADIDGDGNDDAVGFGMDGIYAALSDGSSSFSAQASRWTTAFSNNSGWSVDLYPRMFADVNGDAYDDALGFGIDGVYVALSSSSAPGDDILFNDNFESGDLAAWSSSLTDGDDLQASSAANHQSTYGVTALIDDQNSLQVIDESPVDETHYRARFYLDPNSLSMAAGNKHYIFDGYDNLADAYPFRIELSYQNGYQLALQAIHNDESFSSTAKYALQDDWSSIEIEWQAASAPTVDNGFARLWLNGVLLESLDDLDNDSYSIEEVRLGLTEGLDTGTSGTMYFDQFESRRESYIGADATCYPLTLAHSGQGSDLDASPTNSTGCLTGEYLAGEVISLDNAEPVSGWEIGSWTGTDNDASTGDTNSFSMPTSAHTVNVNYVQSCYVLTLTHTGQGTDPIASPANSTVCAAGEYVANESISLSGAAPDTDWEIVGWTGAESGFSSSPTNTLLMPARDHTVAVNYEESVIPTFENATFTYDGDGQRVKSEIVTDLGTTTTHFVGNYYEETNGVVTKYYYAGGQRIAMREDGNLAFVLSDHLGSTSLVTDAAGYQVSETRYTAWGEVRHQTGNSPTEYGYTGQYSEGTIKLLNYVSRRYDPELGLFIQPDTIIPDPYNPQDYNRYSYVRNNPLRYTDPTGHFSNDQIKQYLKNQYGKKWRSYWTAWKSDDIFMDMLHLAENGDTLRAPTTPLGSGFFVDDGNGGFNFVGENALYQYQGNGPYELLKNHGNDVMVEKELTAHIVCTKNCSNTEMEWDQPLYDYSSGEPVYTGHHRVVKYQYSGYNIDIWSGDNIPWVIGEGIGLGLNFLPAEVGGALAPPIGIALIIASTADAMNNVYTMKFNLIVSYEDRRTYIGSPEPTTFIGVP